MMQLYQKYGKQLFALGDQALVSGSNFILGILLARELGLNAYGSFALAWMGVLFVSSLHQAFMVSPMMTFAPKKGNIINYLTATKWMQLVFAVLIFGLTYLVMAIGGNYFLTENLQSVKWLLPLVTALYVCHDYFRKKYYILNTPIKAFLLDALSYGFQLVCLLYYTFYADLSLATAFWVINAAFVLAIVVALFDEKKWSIDIALIKENVIAHWHYAKWLIGKAVLQWLSGNYFIIAAGGLLSVAAVGVIRIAQNVIGVLNVFFLAMENYVPVNAAKVHNDSGDQALYQYLKNITFKSSGIILGIIVLLAIFAEPIIEWLYGAEYTAYAYVLRGFALLNIFVFVGMPLRFAIRTLEQTQGIFFAYLLSTLFSLFFAYPFIQWWGLYGVIGGLIITQLITQAFYLITIQKYNKKILPKTRRGVAPQRPPIS